MRGAPLGKDRRASDTLRPRATVRTDMAADSRDESPPPADPAASPRAGGTKGSAKGPSSRSGEKQSTPGSQRAARAPHATRWGAAGDVTLESIPPTGRSENAATSDADGEPSFTDARGDYQVRLSTFRGPLDLLLYLIRRAEVDIHDIPVAEITDQFLAFVRADLAHINMEEAGEFLVMAATLIELKARTLAPKRAATAEGEGADAPPQAAADPRTELVQALLAYQRYRRAAERLERHREEFWRRHAIRIATPRIETGHTARSHDEPGAADDVLGESDDGASGRQAGGTLELDDVHVLDLSQAYERIAGGIDFSRLGDHRVEYDDTPIALHQDDLLDRLHTAGRTGITLGSIFEGRSRLEKIGLFLAALELARQRKVAISQSDDVNGEVELREVTDASAEQFASGEDEAPPTAGAGPSPA